MVSAPILQACKHRVGEVVTQAELERHRLSREALAQRIAGIVSRNLASGRAQRIMGVSGGAREQESSGGEEGGEPGTENGRFEAYIDQVIAGYLREHSRVEGLAARDKAAWTRLCEQLTAQAYSILLRRQVPAARATSEAPDFAQQTCEAIFHQSFPYDVPFDAWSTRILQNQILHRHTRSRDLMDRVPGTLSLDRPGRRETGGGFSLYELLADESGESAFERVEVQEWLLQAIASLPSQAQQQVIIDAYFHELSDDEISGDLDKTKQAIYNLRHRALRRLKQILEEQ